MMYLCNRDQQDALFSLNLFQQSSSTCFEQINYSSSGGILLCMQNMVLIMLHIQWLRCCATNQKVAGLIPDSVIGVFH